MKPVPFWVCPHTFRKMAQAQNNFLWHFFRDGLQAKRRRRMVYWSGQFQKWNRILFTRPRPRPPTRPLE